MTEATRKPERAVRNRGPDVLVRPAAVPRLRPSLWGKGVESRAGQEPKPCSLLNYIQGSWYSTIVLLSFCEVREARGSRVVCLLRGAGA
jgi:hypothetical protein